MELTKAMSAEVTYKELLMDIHGSAETADEYAAHAALIAKKSFADHEVERVSEQEYWCSRPNTNIMSFRALFPPGAIIVYGDIGETILTQYNLTMGWLRESVRSPGYYFEKCRTKKYTFSPMDAAEQLDWMVTEDGDCGRETARNMWRSWSPEELEEHELEAAWYSACWEHYGDSITCQVIDWDSLICYEALKWLVTTGMKKKYW